jgi:DNA-binding transcriptional LysR family regulator
MNDRQLRYALSVWRERSFSRAAEKLNVSQPSVSEQIGGLERELGFELFRRTGRGVLVTHKGQTFLRRANQVIDELLDLSDAARELRGGPPVSFAIGFSTSLVIAAVPPTMAALAPLLSKVRIETITAPTRRIQRFVSEERIDAGITIEASARDLPPNVRTERFGRVVIVLAVPPGHRFTRAREPVDLSELADEPLIVHEPDIGYGQQIEAILAGRGLRPNVRAVADDAKTIKLMVQAGAGVALLPRSCVEADAARESLGVVEVRPKLELRMTLVRLAQRPSPSTERYFQLLRAGLAGVRA